MEASEKRPADIISFGRGGHRIQFGKNRTLSGYENPESFVKEMNAGFYERNGCVILEGCPCVDIRKAIETKEGYKHVFSGPMCNPDLQEGQIEECPEPSPIFAAAVADNQFGQLLAVQKLQKAKEPKKAGGLDMVSVAEYLRGWEAVGASVGVLKRDPVCGLWLIDWTNES